MATAAVQLPSSIHHLSEKQNGLVANDTNKHDVTTTLFYYKDPGDGSPPEPTYVG
jgi:hypothetical protein